MGMEFVRVPAGKSWLGGGGDTPGMEQARAPNDFYLGKFEVTQGEWEQVMGNNPSHFSRTGAGQDIVKNIPLDKLRQLPVESVSWDECQEFLSRLNASMQEKGWTYRLPTETEWEYACRAGPMTDQATSAFDYYFGEPTNQLSEDQANFDFVGCLRRTREVGSYQPNRLGLHDMHGNIHEWCNDLDKTGGKVAHRMIRGGGWSHGVQRCRAAGRFGLPPTDQFPDLGLRLARVPVAASQ